jgi:hypothetical protein
MTDLACFAKAFPDSGSPATQQQPLRPSASKLSYPDRRVIGYPARPGRPRSGERPKGTDKDTLVFNPANGLLRNLHTRYLMLRS